MTRAVLPTHPVQRTRGAQSLLLKEEEFHHACAPAGSASLSKGCVDNRVIVVDQQGHIVWQYGEAGVTGSGPNELNVPVFAIQLPNHNIMVVDQGNNRVIEITRAGAMVWQYSQGLSGAAFASRLPNGDTLITDSSHSRILEVTPAKKMVFEYFTNSDPGSNSAPLPTNAVQLANGAIMIADQFNNRILVINPKVQLEYGTLNVTGNGNNQLNGPYTSYVIGDYTGQTPPPSTF